MLLLFCMSSKAKQALIPSPYLPLHTPKHTRPKTQVARLCRHFKDAVIAAGTPRLGLAPLLAALQRLRPGPSFLTPLHADILQLCLLSRCYAPAASLIDEELIDVDPARTGGLTPGDVQLYAYYGGTAALGA